MAMPDPTLGRVQDTGHAGIRQGFQSIMDSLNQNSQMAMSAIENWKQRDYAAQEAEKQRLFQADEALKTRTHEAEQKGLDRQSSEKIADGNNKTSKYVADTHAATQKAIAASARNHEIDLYSMMLQKDVKAYITDKKGNKKPVTNLDGSNRIDWKALVYLNKQED